MKKAENMKSKRLVDTEETARVSIEEEWRTPKKQWESEGIKRRTFYKRLKSGDFYDIKYIPSPKGGGKNGQQLLVRPKTESNPDRYKVHRGEPGCSVVTPLINGEPVLDPGPPIINMDAVFPSSSPPSPRGVGNPSTPQGEPCEVIPPSQGTFLPVPTESQKSKEIGYLRMALLKAWREEISKNGKPKGQVTSEFLKCYNFGHLYPYIYDRFEKISRATLYNWDRVERSGGVQALIPQYHAPAPGPITESEKYILLNCLLHQNRLKVGTAIKFTKTFLTYKKMPSPSSESKLRRFADDFRKTHYPAWVSAREGAKALNDKCLPYAERDWRLLTVGEGLVADGHRLNFQVIDPFTGKPCRATIVLFWDWKSSYPVGWEIMIEENIQCIASALRNAILTLGKIPKWLLIDNGKAFKAKCFTSEIELEDGILYGMFATLGIHTHFSQAYNPQEKPLERFWGTFNNWFERLLPSYTGASIEDKPAYMRRNEKDAQARHNKWVPKVEEVQELLHNWREFYAGQPSRGRDGMKPGEIFEAEKGPGVDSAELYHLMMVKERMKVHRNGVTFNRWHYYDEALSDINDYVVGKYSLSDYSQIYCFYKNEFRCIAKPIEPVHPMASESDFPKDQEAVKRVGALKSRIKRGAKNLLTLIETGKNADLEHSFGRSPEVAEVVKAIEDKRKPAKFTSAFVESENLGDRSENTEKKEGIIVDPRTGLSRPGDGTVHEDQWEKYDWYMAVKKGTPDALNNLDHEWIAEYEATDQWSRIYAKHAIGGEK